MWTQLLDNSMCMIQNCQMSLNYHICLFLNGDADDMLISAIHDFNSNGTNQNVCLDVFIFHNLSVFKLSKFSLIIKKGLNFSLY